MLKNRLTGDKLCLFYQSTEWEHYDTLWENFSEYDSALYFYNCIWMTLGPWSVFVYKACGYHYYCYSMQQLHGGQSNNAGSNSTVTESSILFFI